jgi:hypothetical protein
MVPEPIGPKISLSDAEAILSDGLPDDLASCMYAGFAYQSYLAGCAANGAIHVSGINKHTGPRETIPSSVFHDLTIDPLEHNATNGGEYNFSSLLFDQMQIESLHSDFHVWLSRTLLTIGTPASYGPYGDDPEHYPMTAEFARNLIRCNSGNYSDETFDWLRAKAREGAVVVDAANLKQESNNPVGRPIGSGVIHTKTPDIPNTQPTGDGGAFASACRDVAKSKKQQRSKSVKALRRLAEIYHDGTPDHPYSPELVTVLRNNGINIAHETLKTLVTEVLKKHDPS